jgi:diguanylate cyclase (GGDEF)-like protein/PAS domain S-box-containing protein
MQGFESYKRDIQSTVAGLQHLMTELKTLENAFLTHEEVLWVISEFANDWEYWQAPDGSYKYVSPSCEKITGYLPNDFYQDKNILEDIIVSGDWHRWIEHAHTMITEKEVEPLEFEIRTKGGKTKWIQHVCQPIINSSGENLGIRGSNRDISSMKELQDKLKHMAGHDDLTGLANRALFMEHLEQTLRSAERDRSNFIVAFIDLDKFKTINDTYGHFAGDEVLKRVAADLRKVVRKDDIIARFGGDEFVGIFKVNVQDDVERIKEKILDTINTDIVCYHLEIIFSLSIGMAIYPSDGTTIDVLMNKADKAMYAMKERNATANKKLG